MELHPVANLVSVASDGNYVKLTMAGGRLEHIRSTFADRIAGFPQGHLLEIGRGHAVNRRHIADVDGVKEPRSIVLKNGECLPISRRRADEVEASLNRPGA